MKKKLSWWQILCSVVAGILTLLILVVGSYVIYVCAQFYRIKDNQEIEITNNKDTYKVSELILSFISIDYPYHY